MIEVDVIALALRWALILRMDGGIYANSMGRGRARGRGGEKKKKISSASSRTDRPNQSKEEEGGVLSMHGWRR